MNRPVVPRDLRRRVAGRAEGQCEYCRRPQGHDPFPFHVDHVRAVQHGRETVPDNLAFCCATCNSHKGPNPTGVDPTTDRTTRFFNPRRDRWATHFQWNGPVLVGRTAVGRAAIALLRVNDGNTLGLRLTLSLSGEGWT